MFVDRLRALCSGLPRAFWVLFFGMLVNRMGNFVGPMLTFYLHQERGVPMTAVGALVSLWGLGSVLGATVGGALADRLGRRRTLLIVLPAAAAAMVALGESRAMPAITVWIFAVALLADATRPAVSAAVADLVPERDRARAFSLLYLAANLGFAIAPTVAGWVGPWSWRALFVGDAVTTLMFFAAVRRELPESRPAPVASAGPSSSPRRRGAGHPAFWAFATLVFFSSLLPYATAVPLAGRFAATGFDAHHYGSIVALNGLGIVLVQPFVSGWLTRHPPALLLAVSTLVMGLGVGLHGWADHVAEHVLAVLVWTAGEIVGAGAGPTLVARLAPPEERGRYQGWFTASWALASCVAPLAGGALLEHAGATAPFASAGVLGVICASGLWLWHRRWGHTAAETSP